MKFIKSNWLKGVLLVVALGLLSSCSGVKIADIPVTDKVLKIEEYFQGNSRAYGILFDRSGTPQRHFTVDLVGTWDEETKTLVLDEDFVFDDGEKSQRKWVIKSLGNNRYSGTAPDVIGVAQGEARGNALRWSYVLQVPYKGSTIDLTLDDWMFLAEDDVMINRATMSKFGVKVGEIVISFKK
jgi:hypothetical protein